MLYIDKNGYVDAARIKKNIIHNIERKPMDSVNGIVVHQTGGSTAEGALSNYEKPGANGAHFLIDKEGVILQTASLYLRTNHVGKLKSRCLETYSCSEAEFNAAKAVLGKEQYSRLSNFEKKKRFPDRFPFNDDSIGIEIVGKPISGEGENAIYETVNDRQNDSLKWLVKELASTLGVSMTEVYKEAETAKW
jgi:N-acetyl-anhydromuramyl-L-alanine amidase AmpD